MHCVIKMKKRGDELVIGTVTDAEKLKLFKSKFSEGDLVEVYFEYLSDSGSLGQLARVHAMIRELAQKTGNTFEDMKFLIKEKSGFLLIIERNGQDVLRERSFGDASADELSLAIAACYEVAQQINHPIM